MTTTWRASVSSLMLGLAFAASGAWSARAETWPGTTASIGGAIAARVIAVKCNNRLTGQALTPQEISELDTYIDERQTAFMSGSPANQRFSESVFPRIARDYDRNYSNPDACTPAARDMAKNMLERVRAAQEELRKQAELRH